MFVFELPEVGEGVVEAEIVKWLIEEGILCKQTKLYVKL